MADEEVIYPMIDSRQFRDVLGNFATGVTVITARDQGELVGLSANSFTSISLEPPLIAFAAALTSTTYPRIKSAGLFCVNVLAEGQEDVARVFSLRGVDRFGQVAWHDSPSGGAILDGSLAWLDCSIEAEHLIGDHVLVVGRVHELGLDGDALPLLFFRGRFHLHPDGP
jgi:3-hydroxy-9,10-secoandrosta-1,3,5(10)-triene-9,17-dione monooxygenase reductase component